jgi:hypothetical protein
MRFFKRIHWPGLLGAVTTLTGIVALPEVAALLPAAVAVKIIGAGAVIQAVTKAVHSKGSE